MKKEEDILSASKEDYLETILMLSENGAPVRLVDIAKTHDVSKATVSDTLSKLGESGYLIYEKYKPVTLTKRGRSVASRTLDKHNLLIRFLNGVLGVSYSEAEEAACKMEHAIGTNITYKLSEFMKRFDGGGLHSANKTPAKNGKG